MNGKRKDGGSWRSQDGRYSTEVAEVAHRERRRSSALGTLVGRHDSSQDHNRSRVLDDCGGSHNSKMPEGSDIITATIARTTGSIVAELKNVPNQPLVFHNDGTPRTEDDLLGYAWSQFLENGDPTWLPRLPMVKSACALWTASLSLLLRKAGGKRTINKFVVGGGSKARLDDMDDGPLPIHAWLRSCPLSSTSSMQIRRCGIMRRLMDFGRSYRQLLSAQNFAAL